MLIKDKDILSDEKKDVNIKQVKKPRIKKENMHAAWGDAFDYYIRGITEKYLRFRGRASRLEFWGFFLVSGLLFLLLSALGNYAEIPMLAYYYAMATAIPAVAVTARRLHDVNKNALVYLGIFVLTVISAVIIGWWALIPILLWTVVLIRMLSMETDISEGLYGAADESDEIYGEDNIRIIRKFRFLAIFFTGLILALSFVRFDDWSRQAQFMATNDAIMEKIAEDGRKANMSEAQIKAAQKLMTQTLKSWTGKTVQENDITEAIAKSLKMIQETKAQ